MTAIRVAGRRAENQLAGRGAREGCWCRGTARRRDTPGRPGSGRLGPFAPAVAVEPVGPEPPPERGAADAEALGGFRQPPAVLVQSAHDRLALALGKCRRTRGAL